MSKLLRCICLLVIVTCLLSCDAFLLLRGGRFNPLDPKNDLEWTVISVIENGYVDSTETRYFDEPILRSDWSGPDIASVIRFDESELPENVISATLEMYTTPASIGTSVQIWIIGQPWTPETLPWMPFYDGTIRDMGWSMPIEYLLPYSDSYNLVDVTDLIRYVAENDSTYGIFFAWNTEYVEFYSTRGPHPPILRVAGGD